MFYTHTSNLVSTITNRFPGLSTGSILEIYRAVATWYKDRTGTHVARQEDLEVTLDLAMICANTLGDSISAAANSPPSADAPITPHRPGDTWTDLELDILSTLHYSAKKGEELAKALRKPWPTVRDALRKDRPLRRTGIVRSRSGLGYYRTDAPPDLGKE